MKHSTPFSAGHSSGNVACFATRDHSGVGHAAHVAAGAGHCVGLRMERR